MSDFYLDKLVYITGGSSGIGLALACEAVAQGASVLLIARNVDKLQQAVELVESHKTQFEQRVNYLSLDLTDADATAADIAPAISAYGTPNVLITCAGVAVAESFEDGARTYEVAYFRFSRIHRVDAKRHERKRKGAHGSPARRSGFESWA